jgi:hypothetical protein
MHCDTRSGAFKAQLTIPGLSTNQHQPLIPTVIISRDGSRAVRVENLDGIIPVEFDKAAIFTVREDRRGSPQQIAVLIDHAMYSAVQKLASDRGRDATDLIVEGCLRAVAQHVDRGPLPQPRADGLIRLDATDAMQSLWKDPTPPATDEDLFAYMTHRIILGWQLGESETDFTEMDGKRLGVEVRQFERIGIAGEGKYWRQTMKHPLRYIAMRKLLEDFEAGGLAGMTTAATPFSKLVAAPRYQAPLDHYTKAQRFLTHDEPDLPNALKELIATAESLSKLALGVTTGTLGDHVKDLRARGMVRAPLDTILEKLWGYSSNAPGVRHGGVKGIDHLDEAEARFAIGIAESSLPLLLSLDRPE